MHSMPQTKGGVPALVMLITGLFVLLGAFLPWLLRPIEPFLVLGMMVVLGLPHGATDHGLFQALRMNGSKKRFYMFYGAVIGLYGLLWYALPLIAFLLFIALSVYHFGQSNWADIDYGKSVLARGHYLLWGAGVLLTPIVLHAEEAIRIVDAMTGITFPLPERQLFFIGVMGILNLLIILAAYATKTITGRRGAWEIGGYLLLMALFFTNSLLMGFTVYFVCWHSLSSARDQQSFFSRRLSPDLRRQLYREIGGTVLGAVAFCLIIWLGPGPEAALRPDIIGGVFVALSLLTLPHMLLIEQLYTRWSPVKGLEKSSASSGNESIRITH